MDEHIELLVPEDPLVPRMTRFERAMVILGTYSVIALIMQCLI